MLFQKIIRYIRKHFQDNFILYFILTLSLIIGVIIGPFILGKLNSAEKDLVLRFTNSFFKNNYYDTYSKFNIFKSSILTNLLNVVAIFLLGFISKGFIIIPIFLAVKGINIGITVAYLIGNFGLKGFLVSVFGVYPQNILIIPSLIIIGALAMSESFKASNMVKKRIYRKKDLTIEEYSIIIILLFLVISAGSVIEGFISPFFLRFATKFII